MKIDGDASRAARLAAREEPIEYHLGGQVFTFPPEVPLDYLGADEHEKPQHPVEYMVASLARLSVDEDFTDRLAAVRHPDGTKVSLPDIDEMYTAVFNAYAVDPGESSASDDSSETAGATSPGTSPDGDSTPPTSTGPVEAESGA